MAVADVAELDELWGVTHATRSIAKQGLLLCRRHQLEQLARLLEIVAVVLVVAPVLSIAVDLQRRLGEVRLRLSDTFRRPSLDVQP